MSTACGRPQGMEGGPMWTHVNRGEGVKNLIFCGRHKWMVPYALRFPPVPVQFLPILQVPPIFRCSYICSYTKFSFPYQNVTFPSPKLTKPFVSPLNEKFPP